MIVSRFEDSDDNGRSLKRCGQQNKPETKQTLFECVLSDVLLAS
jgi:hypothetical protein